MMLAQILCNEQFFVNVYFKLEKTFSSDFKWTLVPFPGHLQDGLKFW